MSKQRGTAIMAYAWQEVNYGDGRPTGVTVCVSCVRDMLKANARTYGYSPMFLPITSKTLCDVCKTDVRTHAPKEIGR